MHNRPPRINGLLGLFCDARSVACPGRGIASTRSQEWHYARLLVMLAGVLWALLAPAVQAAPIPVDGTTCTLVDAITAANTDAASGGCSAGSGADTLTLSAPITLTVAYASSSNGLPVITSTITLDGAGYRIAREATAGQFRLLAVGSAGHLTLDRVILAGGNVAGDGGGISNSGHLTITNSVIMSHTGVSGGGLYNAASAFATVRNSTLSGNVANTGAGIHNAGTLTVTNNTLSQNVANQGGGLLTMENSTLTMSRNLISGNTSGSGGNEVFKINPSTVNNLGYNLFGYEGSDGLNNVSSVATDISGPSVPITAILNPILTDTGAVAGYPNLTHALVAGSLAIDAADPSGLSTDQRGMARPQGMADDIGAVELMAAALQGRDCLLADAIAAANQDIATGNCLAGSGDDTITLMTHITLTAAYQAGDGLPPITSTLTIAGEGYTIARSALAAPFRVLTVAASGQLMLDQVTVRGGDSTSGAGILNAGLLTIRNSTVRDNTATNGGGLENTGTLTITSSTIRDNTASGNGGALLNSATATLINSTLSGNGAATGGGLYNTATLRLTHTTLTGNSATNGGGLSNSGTLTLVRNLISGNTATTGAEIDNAGSVTSNSYNLIGHSSSAQSNGFSPAGTDLIPSVAPAAILNPTLGDHGGDTWSHALMSSSPAIDAAGNGELATDQRGRARPQGVADDMGALEAVVNAQLNGSDCDLIDAINAANGDTAVGGCAAGSGADLITLIGDALLIEPDGAFSETSVGLPSITSTLTISGAGYTLRRDPAAPSFSILLIEEGAVVTLTNSMVTGGDSFMGGGIINLGELTLLNSTVYSNVAVLYGGGIVSTNYLTMTNSTISGNRSTAFGGGVLNLFGMAKLTHNTISGNTSAQAGGGLVAAGLTTLTGNLISGNTAPGGAEVYAVLPITSTYNLYGHTNISGTPGLTLDGTDIVPSVPITNILNPTLADNGGDTWTHALAIGSPALDAAGDSGLASDQRGVARPQGAADDIGAMENGLNSILRLPTPPTTLYAVDPHPTHGAQSPAGIYTITASFQNTATPPVAIYDVYFQVKQINHANGENYLLNADGGPGQVGATLSIANNTLPSGDDRWSFSETLPVDFVIGLDERRQFTFKVDLYGLTETVTAAAAGAPPLPIYLESFTFTFDPAAAGDAGAQRLFLPLVTK